MSDNTSSVSNATPQQYNYASSSVGTPLFVVAQSDLQQTNKKLEYVVDFNQRVISQLVKAHSILYTINILYRSLLVLLVVILGGGLYWCLHQFELLNRMYTAWISGIGVVSAIIAFIFLVKKIPNDLKQLEDRIDELERKNIGFNDRITNLENKIDELQNKISSK